MPCCCEDRLHAQLTLRVPPTGTWFVVGRSPEGAHVKWSVDAYASSFAAPSSLRCWKVGADCGPLYAGIAPLPPGADPEPKGLWKLRLTGDGVRDLGHHWSDPELHWLDRLFAAVEGGHDTKDLASPEVIRQLKLHAEDLHGMLMSWSVQRGPATVLRASVEDLTCTFTLTRRGNLLYATAVTIED